MIYVGMERFDAGTIAGKQRTAPIGMPRGDANREISILQMADNAAAEKSGATKYGHASGRHVTKYRAALSYAIIFSAFPEA